MKSRFVVIFVFILLFSCTKDDRELFGEFLLRDLIYTNPFTGSEVLVYQTSGNILSRLIGKGRSRTLHEGYIHSDMKQYYITESDRCNFSKESGKFSFVIILQSTYINAISYDMHINIYDYKTNLQEESSAISSFKLPLSIDNLHEGQIFYDSIFVLNKIYYDVYMSLVSISEPPPKNDSIHPNKIYYNKAYGILKVNFSDSTSWELAEIIQND